MKSDLRITLLEEIAEKCARYGISGGSGLEHRKENTQAIFSALTEACQRKEGDITCATMEQSSPVSNAEPTSKPEGSAEALEEIAEKWASDYCLKRTTPDGYSVEDAILSALTEACRGRESRIQRLKEALEKMLPAYLDLKRLSLRLARFDNANWMPGMTEEHDIYVVAARAALSEENKKDG